MKIKTKLQLSIVFTLIMIIVVPLTFRASRLKTGELEERRKLNLTMTKGMSELKSVTLDYLLHADERARTQWYARFESMKRLATDIKSISPKNKELLDNVREDLDVIRGIFLQLEASHNRLITPRRGYAAKDVENMLVSQLMIRTDAIINNTFRIQENFSAEALADQQRANLMVTVFLGMLAILMTINTLLLRRDIARPLLRLREGTEIIAGGELAYRVGTSRDDEIGDLSRAFDEMADKLQRSYGNLTNEIAERKRAEEALKKVNEELEHRVVGRTAELAAKNEKLKIETTERVQAVEALRDKERMLIQQSRQAAMGEMIGNIAHQWRQPLNNLGLSIQQLELYYELGEFTKEFLGRSVGKSMELIEHMSKTIDDFRNFFEPEKEKVEFKVSEAIENTLSLIEDNFKSKNIGVEVVRKGDPTIYGYRNEFAQVLLNILNNASDVLTERASIAPKVTVTLCSEGDRTIVSVADNAGGIPDESISKVFDPYFTTKGPQQGTGVGLYMSKSIIEKNMGGKLTVRNIADGAEFRIEVRNGVND